MANPWFRLYHEFATDPKVQRLSESDQRRFVMLLCLMCSNGNSNALCNGDVAFWLRITETEWVSTQASFLAVNLIDENNIPTNWVKRQRDSDADPTRAERQKRYREKHSNALHNAIVTGVEEKRIEQNRIDTEEKAIATGKPSCPHQEIINLYHEILPVCPKVKDWTPARASTLKARWDENPERQNLEYWEGFFKYVAESRFLTGKTETQGRKPFLASLPWMLKPENFAKIREAHYA